MTGQVAASPEGAVASSATRFVDPAFLARYRGRAMITTQKNGSGNDARNQRKSRRVFFRLGVLPCVGVLWLFGVGLLLLGGPLLAGCTRGSAPTFAGGPGDKETAGKQAVAKDHRRPDETHLRNVRQLTFGGENAEAYLSFDETRLVFQSTRPPFQCDQIFSMKLDGSDVQQVSSGKGRTTCSYYLPGDTKILYASTHLGSEDCPRRPDRSHGYVWAIYPSYDIFVKDLGTGELERLTDTPGYDAEATISPVGDRIVFTSVRDGDIEIYSMKLDGTDVKRLTHELGYDGGPFFSFDGKKIVYRTMRLEGEKQIADYKRLLAQGLVRPSRLEIFVMDADGKNKRQVTHAGAASFAPFFHPDGKRIIFSSNLGDPKHRNFDLYLVNVNGSGLERLTTNATFDGFPMFTRDGKRLVFCSNRDNRTRGETNAFIADWVD